MVRSIYKSADMEGDLHVTWEPVHRIRHMKGHFGVVFHTQSNGEVNVQISWHGRWPSCNLGISAQNKAYEGSSLEDFLRLTHPTSGVQKAIGPVNMKCPEAQTLNFEVNIPFPVCDLASARFLEDFLKLTQPTSGVQKAIGPVNMKCPEGPDTQFWG